MSPSFGLSMQGAYASTRPSLQAAWVLSAAAAVVAGRRRRAKCSRSDGNVEWCLLMMAMHLDSRVPPFYLRALGVLSAGRPSSVRYGRRSVLTEARDAARKSCCAILRAAFGGTHVQVVSGVCRSTSGGAEQPPAADLLRSPHLLPVPRPVRMNWRAPSVAPVSHELAPEAHGRSVT